MPGTGGGCAHRWRPSDPQKGVGTPNNQVLQIELKNGKGVKIVHYDIFSSKQLVEKAFY